MVQRSKGAAWRRAGRARGGGRPGARSGRPRQALAWGDAVGGDRFPLPGGAVRCWERQGAALGLGGRLRCRLRAGDRDGMATVRRAPWVAMITAAARVAPVRFWCAGQVREVGRGGGVQGIEEQTPESIYLIFSSSDLGKNRVVHTTCSTKCHNRI